MPPDEPQLPRAAARRARRRRRIFHRVSLAVAALGAGFYMTTWLRHPADTSMFLLAALCQFGCIAGCAAASLEWRVRGRRLCVTWKADAPEDVWLLLNPPYVLLPGIGRRWAAALRRLLPLVAEQPEEPVSARSVQTLAMILRYLALAPGVGNTSAYSSWCMGIADSVRQAWQPMTAEQEDLAIGFLHALSLHGGQKHLPLVRRIAAGEGRSAGCARAQQAAVECAAAIEARLALGATAGALLRPADAPPGETLLRPTSASPDQDAEVLLRPTTAPEEQAECR